MTKATKEQWKDFQEKVDNRLDKTNIDNLLKCYQQRGEALDNERSTSQETKRDMEKKLEEIWLIFQESLIKTAKTTLPLRKVKTNGQNKDRKNTITEEHQRYRQSFKLLKSLNKAEKSREQEDFTKLREATKKFNSELRNTTLRIEIDNLMGGGEVKWREKKKEIKEVITTLREEAYRTQNSIKLKEINEAIEQRCQYFQSNQRKMIDSLTNSSKKSVQIDRVMVAKGQDKYIEMDPREICKEVEEYYIKAFKRRKSDFERLDTKWKKQYEPRDYIKQEWYKDLLNKPSPKELLDVIKSLPAKKAAGPSQITYEMLKNLSLKTRERLNNIFHCCLITNNIPKSWKNSNIYPIPKNKEWGAKLSNTRPIMLMESTRKCFTKIITNRISIICKEKNVLRGSNFAGLPGESTLEPI